MRRDTLNQRQGNDHWISPLLSQLNLIQAREVNTDPSHYWRIIEECQLLERVGKVIAEVNGAAGYHVLEMLEYLPPQKKVFQIGFDRNRVQHKMELALPNEGILLMFSTAKLSSARWDRYFPQNSMKSNATIVWEQLIHPEEILAKDIQAWFSFLLSGLDKKYSPDSLLATSPSTDSGLSAALRKASA
jgi:hypothetical protein